ncbi:MAG TPA: RcpC/CpaB family pilus assembly protein [Acidimicrobiales bacterium]|nr:RcpC/CpaB family pilus assembly protein [Acidimicrobiales bacterium]
MTDLATAPAPTGNGHRTRAVTRRRGLPGGRAVIGGFLVAASATGVFAAWSASSEGPATSYAVVVGDVAAGDRLEADDLTLVALDLPPAQRRLAFADTGALVGAVALAPMRDGQLVQVSDVARPVGAPERAQISLRLDPGAAVGGDLRPGDTVDVIVTYTTGGQPVTSTVSRGALVVRVLAGDQRVGASGSVVLVLAVLPAELEPIASASAAGHVTIARMTGVAE